MLWISRLASPFVWILSKSTEGVVALLGLKVQESLPLRPYLMLRIIESD